MNYANMTREQLICELQFLDPNGCWTDEDCENENFPVMTREDALRYIANLLNPEA